MQINNIIFWLIVDFLFHKLCENNNQRTVLFFQLIYVIYSSLSRFLHLIVSYLIQENHR